jgi:hypothetical protein
MTQPRCPSCRMRYQLPPPAARDNYNPMLLLAKEVHWLENAARHFDEIAGEERFTAADFIDWLKPDLNGKWPKPPAPIEGTKPRAELAGRDTVRHRHPDPLPMVPMKLRKLVS